MQCQIFRYNPPRFSALWWFLWHRKSTQTCCLMQERCTYALKRPQAFLESAMTFTMVELLLTVTLISAESIHAHFNRIEMQYNGIVNPLDRLMSSMSTTWSQHLVSILCDRNLETTGNAPKMTHHNCSSLTSHLLSLVFCHNLYLYLSHSIKVAPWPWIWQTKNPPHSKEIIYGTSYTLHPIQQKIGIIFTQ